MLNLQVDSILVRLSIQLLAFRGLAMMPGHFTEGDWLIESPKRKIPLLSRVATIHDEARSRYERRFIRRQEEQGPCDLFWLPNPP